MKSASIEFDFEIQQKCRFELYHCADPGSEDLGTYTFIGSSEVYVGEMVSTGPGEDCRRELVHHQRRHNGYVYLNHQQNPLAVTWFTGFSESHSPSLDGFPTMQIIFSLVKSNESFSSTLFLILWPDICSQEFLSGYAPLYVKHLVFNTGSKKRECIFR